MGSVSIALPYDDRWYFAEVLRGVCERVQAAGHEVITHVFPPAFPATDRAVDALTEDFAAHDSIGGIAVGIKYRPEVHERVLAWERPLVVVGGSVMGFPTVLIDDLGGARTATQHLLSLGHTRIVHLAGNLTDQMDFSVHGRRARGYRQAMESAGLEPDVVESEFEVGDATTVAHALLTRRNRPTAIFCVSDEIAFVLMRVAQKLGIRIGEDLSVIGFDDHPRAAAMDLSTIRQVPSELGAHAAGMLLGGLGHGLDPKQSKLMPVSLVKRNSTRRVRA